MRRRPLLRAAAVGGGAYAMGRKRAKQEERIAGLEEQIQQPQVAPMQPQAAPPPTPASGGLSPAVLAQLEQLGELHEKGILTDEEFAEQKRRCLAGGMP